MSLFAMLKTNAKRALKGHWGTAVCALLITAGAAGLLAFMRGMALEIFVGGSGLDPAFALRYGFSEYFFEQFAASSLKELIIVAVFSLLGFFLLAPLGLGATRWYYELIQGRDKGLGEIFRYFESGRRYARSLLLELNLLVRAFLWALLFYAVPSAILTASVYAVIWGDPASPRAAFASVGILLAAALLLLVTVFYLVTVNRYALAAYLMAEDDETTVRQAIKASVEYSRGYRFSLLWFELSFIGWMLLGLFLLPLLYVAPYLNASVAMYARFIIEKNRYAAPNPTREFSRAEAEELLPSAEGGVPLQDALTWNEPELGPVDAEMLPGQDGEEPSIDRFRFPVSQYPVQPETPGEEAAADPEPQQGADERGNEAEEPEQDA